MTQVGEPVAVSITPPAAPPQKGSLTVTIKEQSSGDPIEGVKVKLSGPGSGEAATDSSGKAQFSGLEPGTYDIALEQDEFELKPAKAAAPVTPGGSDTVEIKVQRVILTLTMKRIHIQGLLKAARGDKSELEYGHWWVEIDGAESYGWWPGGQVGLKGTFMGVPGALNGVPHFAGGSPTRDPHHGDTAEEMFHPRVKSGQAAAAIKTCVRGFAAAYSGKWSWPWGQNCHSFQEAMMKHCKLHKGGSKKAT